MNEATLEQEGMTSALDITLRDIALFSNWMQEAIASIEHGHSVPAVPEVGSEQVRVWIHAIQKLDERSRIHDDRYAALETNLNAQEAQLDQVLSQLYLNTACLYESLGHMDKAREVREKSSAGQPR
jgi:hypothetical protein